MSRSLGRDHLRSPDSSKHNGLQSQVEVSVLVNDCSVVAAELQECFTETVLYILADNLANSFGPSEAN